MRSFVLVLSLVLLAACSGESALPNPTGKGTVRAINAVPGSPTIAFLIEERQIGTINFGATTAGIQFDDFQYNFNFQTNFLGENSPRRVGTILHKVETGRDYTFVLTGTTDAPTITVWETAERVFDGAATTFQVQFAHTAENLGAVDYYFAAPGTVLMAGEEQGTLNFGEVLAPVDFTGGDYVLTVTAPGDPLTIHYQSDTTTYVNAQSIYLGLFDGDENDTGPHVARLINAGGGSLPLPDPRFPPTIRFIQAAKTLANADVYDDEMLTNIILPNHAFGDITGDLDTIPDQVTYTYTVVGNSGAPLLTSGNIAAPGRRYDFVAVQTDAGFLGQGTVADRRAITIFARFKVNHLAFDNQGIDMYVLPDGEVIDVDTLPNSLLVYTLATPPLALETGSYDIYLTVTGDQTVIAGPVDLDITVGEFVEAFIFDTVDPAVPELRIVPLP